MIESVIKNKQEVINEKLESLLKAPRDEYQILFDSMNYSLLAGGKRIRPILFLLALELFGIDSLRYAEIACAIECVHTYSLVHDDLPAMDNDDYRRGRLTNHRKYGAGIATMAGDGLLTYAFELLARQEYLLPEIRVKLILILAKASGAIGMVGGQAYDKLLEGKEIGEQELAFLDDCKTGQLLCAPLDMAAEISSPPIHAKRNLHEFGKHLGRLFQITDDLLDVNGSLEEMGKKPLQDITEHKATYVTILGKSKAQEKAVKEAENAIRYIEEFGGKGVYLRELVEFILKRAK